jgi:hypothetical protein
MCDGTETGYQMTDTTDTTQGESNEGEGEQQEQAATFTQADVEKIVKDRLAQQAKNKFGDYDDLKSKAGQTVTAEERLAALEGELSSTKAEALRSRIAAKFGISTEAKDGSDSDADLFLTGTDEATLTTQATRLSAREGERRKLGNVASKEGAATNSGTDDGLREFTRQLFKPGS